MAAPTATTSSMAVSATTVPSMAAPAATSSSVAVPAATSAKMAAPAATSVSMAASAATSVSMSAPAATNASMAASAATNAPMAALAATSSPVATSAVIVASMAASTATTSIAAHAAIISTVAKLTETVPTLATSSAATLIAAAPVIYTPLLKSSVTPLMTPTSMSPPRTTQSITVVPIIAHMANPAATTTASMSQIVIEEDPGEESSDGISTISDAYERHVAQGASKTHPSHLQDVGGAKAPNTDSELTWTASESWDDGWTQWSDANEEYWATVTPESSRKREIQESTEDESEVIRINVGSFANSTLGRENKKAKNT